MNVAVMLAQASDSIEEIFAPICSIIKAYPNVVG